MMPLPMTVCVEGDHDKRFIEALLRHMLLSGVEVVCMAQEVGGGAKSKRQGRGGISYLRKLGPDMTRRKAQGWRIAVAVDADGDAVARRDEILRIRDEYELPFDDRDLFLVPNNKGTGCLETLLREIATPQHRAVHDCFTKYVDCLESLHKDYDLPGLKARIYAYCEAIRNGPKEWERDYGRADHWDLDAPALAPLKAFLRTRAGAAPIDVTE